MTFHYNHTKPNGKVTILCLDDDFIELKLLELHLKQLFDINLITSQSSLEVLAYLQNNTVDMIIQDIIRPEMDGWEFLSSIRHRDDLKELPILFLTSLTIDDDFIEKAQKEKINYISKPCHAQELKEKILNIFPHILSA